MHNRQMLLAGVICSCGHEGQPAAVPEPQLLQHGEQGQRLRPENQADAAAAEPSLAAQQRRQSVITTHSFVVSQNEWTGGIMTCSGGKLLEKAILSRGRR